MTMTEGFFLHLFYLRSLYFGLEKSLTKSIRRCTHFCPTDKVSVPCVHFQSGPVGICFFKLGLQALLFGGVLGLIAGSASRKLHCGYCFLFLLIFCSLNLQEKPWFSGKLLHVSEYSLRKKTLLMASTKMLNLCHGFGGKCLQLEP